MFFLRNNMCFDVGVGIVPCTVPLLIANSHRKELMDPVLSHKYRVMGNASHEGHLIFIISKKEYIDFCQVAC